MSVALFPLACRAALLLAACCAGIGSSVAQVPTPAQQQLRELDRDLVEINTTDSAGSCTVAAEAMQKRLLAGGIPASDIRIIVPPGAPKKGNLVARHRGTGAKKPILLLGHLDVAEARREDWVRDPFTLIEEGGYFYARGATDDKSMVAIFLDNLIRYRREGWRPARDIIVAATCDEEIIPSKFNGVEYLLKNHRALIDAEFALNEGAGSLLDDAGKPVRMGIQAGEKMFQTYTLETTDPGGHSAMPRKDNAIAHMAARLARLGAHDWPFKLSETTRAYFERIKVSMVGAPTPSPAPPLTREIMAPVEQVSAQMWPGVPLVPTLLVAATDSRFLNSAGIPAYGLSGMFRDPDGGGVHGLNERLRVQSLYEGHEFLYRVVKLYAGGH